MLSNEISFAILLAKFFMVSTSGNAAFEIIKLELSKNQLICPEILIQRNLLS